MKQKQKRRIFSAFFLGVSLFALVPFIAPAHSSVFAQANPSALESGGYSGLIPCGRSGNKDVDPSAQPCTACHAVVGAKRLMDYLTGIMVVVAIAVIVAMGVLYILSGVSADLKKKAKGGLTAVFFGLVFMLSAWLIVSTILRFMANDNLVQGGGGFIGLMPGDGAYGLQCSTKSDAGTVKLTNSGVQAGGGAYTGGATGSVGSGACAPITSPGNPCSVENLKKHPCWAALGDTVIAQASGICNAESKGIATIRSGASATDHCGCAACPVVSQGLFQVNMTAHYSSIGCPKIAQPPLTSVKHYSDGWYDASCKMQVDDATYRACANKTIDPAWNIDYACQLYKKRGNWSDWSYSYKNKCNSFK